MNIPGGFLAGFLNRINSIIPSTNNLENAFFSNLLGWLMKPKSSLADIFLSSSNWWMRKIHTTRVEHQRIVVAKKDNCFQFWAFLFFLLRYSLEISRFGLQQKPLHPGIPQTQWKSKPSGLPVKKMEGKSKLRQMLLGKCSKDFPVKNMVHEFWVGVIEWSLYFQRHKNIFFPSEKGTVFAPSRFWVGILRGYRKGDPRSKKRFMPSLRAIFLFLGKHSWPSKIQDTRACDEGSP